MRDSIRLAARALCAVLAGCAPLPAPRPGSLQPEVIFTRPSPLSRGAEIVRRTLPPLTARYGQEALAARGEALREQSIDLQGERFALYVPAGEPPAGGYGLLVFISPGDEAVRPNYWRAPLDRHRLIFVSAAGSGNEAGLLDRRLPLALLAYENVRARYPLDPDRVYVGGLSGGSRVAEMVALGYPDVFRGALLIAGSDPIGGEQGIYLPPEDLFHRFQRSRLVFVTGARDDVNLDDDAVTLHSLRDFCVFNLEVKQPPRMGHELPDANALDSALDALDQRPAPDLRKLAECNASLQRELASGLAAAGAARAAGDRDGARARLRQLDARYGGLAASAILALDETLR